MCGFLIAFGLLTRLAAFIASGEMAVAFFIFGFSGKVPPSRADRAETILTNSQRDGISRAVLLVLLFLCLLWPGPMEYRRANQA